MSTPSSPRVEFPQQTDQSIPLDAAGRREDARMIAIDLARFLAIAGMMCAHLLPPAGMPGHLPWLGWLVDGNASTLFAMLGGVSIVLASRRYRSRGKMAAARIAILTRGVIVIALGATLALVSGSVIVVLVYFGVAMICAVPFLRVRPGWLVAWAVALSVIGPILNAVVRNALNVAVEGGSLEWSSLSDPLTALRAIFLTGTYPVVTWIVYMLIGMAVAGWLLTARHRGTGRVFLRRLAAAGSVLTVAAVTVNAAIVTFVARDALAIRLPDIPAETREEMLSSHGMGSPMPSDAWWSFLLGSPHTGTIVDIARGTGISFLIVAGLSWLVLLASPRFLRLLEPVRAAGAAPLTIYTLHVAAIGAATTLALHLMETGAEQIPWWCQGSAILAIHLVGAVLIGLILAMLHRRGPLEALVSTISAQAARVFTRSTGQ